MSTARMMPRPLVLLVQLPIPPPGPAVVRGNVPLAAGYLALFARRRGLDSRYRIEILPSAVVNYAGDEALVEAILQRQPWLVGFTCYLWNIERTLWVAQRLKQLRPETLVVLGGPEITADNAWVLGHGSADYAVLGEGEQTFAELLQRLAEGPAAVRHVAGLWAAPPPGQTALAVLTPPAPRPAMDTLDQCSSPYVEGILDVADEKTMYLETVRGCAFGCKYCYYPKSYDRQYFLSDQGLQAALGHAVAQGAEEVVLLDPTLNQRRDFADFLRTLAAANPGRQLTYFGELRAEGITPELAALLAEANFSEVEIGLQSLEPETQKRMGRRLHLKAFEHGARAMLEAGIKLRVDLILGLPGDTPQSVRRGIEYLRASGLYTSVQVFNLSVLPGTAFRAEAAALGMHHQGLPPYYVLKTPDLELAELYGLMAEAQAAFGLEFDPVGPPVVDFRDEAAGGDRLFDRVAKLDLDGDLPGLPPAERRAGVFTLWLRSSDFAAHRAAAAGLVRQLLHQTPHTSLQVVLEPLGEPGRVTPAVLAELQEACFESLSYLDRFYSLHPKSLLGAKRLVVVCPAEKRPTAPPAWIEGVGRFAALVWSGGAGLPDDLAEHEFWTA